MIDLITVVLNYAIILPLLYLISKDAAKHNIYLSKLTKILFLLTITAPFVAIWYFLKRKQNKENIAETETELS